MQRDIEAYYFDIRNAIDDILDFTRGIGRDDYPHNGMVRCAVERQFITIGEAINAVIRLKPEAEEQLTAARQIIAFRNILVHGYYTIQNELVWQTIHDGLPALRREVDALLDEAQER